jgi:hypothetical protein
MVAKRGTSASPAISIEGGGRSAAHLANVESAVSFPQLFPAPRKRPALPGAERALNGADGGGSLTGHARKNAKRRHWFRPLAACTLYSLESLSRMQPGRHDDVMPKISKKDFRMAPRPSVTKHPFTLMFVVIALIAPFAGLAWRTREWMGW